MATGITTQTGLTLGYASRGTRFIGQMIDGFIASLPLGLASRIAGTGDFLGPALAIVATMWCVYYLILADAFHDGQSLAKQWLGVRVVDAATGAPCTRLQSVIRNALGILGPIDWIFIFGEQ